MSEFLLCNPTVFVINHDYEILVLTKQNGIISIEIDGKIFRPVNSGVLASEKNYARIRLPQSALDKAKHYMVGFLPTINRTSYTTQMGEKCCAEFEFTPLTKTEDIHIYHSADIHGDYLMAEKLLEYFDNIDLFIFNGDIIEVESTQNYYNSIEFLGKVTKGNKPVIFTRGNHDTRGHLAEDFPLYFPNNNQNFYYTFYVGPIVGVVLDCGEDKVDEFPVYCGTNDFSSYRQRETEFLSSLNFDCDTSDKWVIAISHICPNKTDEQKGGLFDIERETYSNWTKQLERLNIQCMLCAHLHYFLTLNSGDEGNLIEHKYPIFTCSAKDRQSIGGGAITVNSDGAVIRYTDDKLNVINSYYLKKNSFHANKIR